MQGFACKHFEVLKVRRERARRVPTVGANIWLMGVALALGSGPGMKQPSE